MSMIVFVLQVVDDHGYRSRTAVYGAPDVVDTLIRFAEITRVCYAVDKEPAIMPDDVVGGLQKVQDLVI